jgi:peptidoglycan hydrolase-like protein with peptidoglycan-binding domain
VQERLTKLGLYHGPADGYLEKTTQKALAEFQKQASLQPTGVPTPMTRNALLGS